MSIVILYIDSVDGQVKITKEGKQIPSFLRLYEEDSSPGKKFFRSAIAFIFYVYAIGEHGSPFQNIFFKNRCTIAARDKWVDKERDPEEYLENKLIIRVIDEFNEYSKSKLERFQEKLFDDMEKTIEELNKIQMKKKIFVELDINFGTDESPDIRKVKKQIEVDNSIEKMKIYKNIGEIYDLQKKYEQMIATEKITEGKKGYIFDTKETGLR